MSYIKFWGVRGSIPTPGPTTIKYGGNTSCVELRHENKLFILDAGSGIRPLGNELLKIKSSIIANIFISHMHWDHIQGIPFFTPAYIPGNQFTFYGSENTQKDLATIIADQMDPTYFPIELKDMAASLNFKNLSEGRYNIDDTQIETVYVNHPGNALGYKLNLDGKTIVYISDNEPFTSGNLDKLNSQQDSSDPLIGEDGNQKLINFIKNSDILIHDAQYTEDEYTTKISWGHSPLNYTVNIAIKADVKKLILFHHDPLHDDDMIDKMLEDAKDLAKKSNHQMDILAAQEEMIIEI